MTEGIHEISEARSRKTRKPKPKAEKPIEQMTDAELIALLDPNNTTA